jgi:iron complex outermembrane recepter protein
VLVPGGVSQVIPRIETEESSFTYLVTPRFRVSQDLMVYARLASGYRPGAPNSNAVCGGNIACVYGPDETLNYEIGVKGSMPGRALSFDASLYYIDWKDIQIQAIISGRGFFENGGRAKSQGVELSVESRPLDGMTLSAWVTYNEAELTEDFPVGTSTRGFEGDRLPFSSPLSGNLSLDQEFPLASGVTGFAGASASYVDNRKGVFTPSGLRALFPAYVQTDVRAGIKYESWEMNLFVNNVADERGVVTIESGPPVAIQYIQPRTVGLALSKSF